MADLVCCLSTGKGTWIEAKRLIEKPDFDNVYVITNDFGKQNFKTSRDIEFLVVDNNKGLRELIEGVKKNLDGKVKGTEVALNIVSGSGKEHMAIISAILKLGLGFRLVTVTDSGEIVNI